MIGYEAIIAAAQRGGCTFVAGRSSVLAEPLLAAAKAALGPSAVRQADDAVAALGYCLGAAAAGAAAMAFTSGSALSACGESIALAQVAELPIVLVHYQHLGSADGGEALPGDVDVTLARCAVEGGLPLPVFAATDEASARRLAYSSVKMAQQLRGPVILLASTSLTMPEDAADPDFGDLPAVSARQGISGERRILLEAAARPGCVQFAGLVDGRRVFLNIDPGQVGGLFGRLQDKILLAGESLEYVRADIDPDAETLVLSYGLADVSARQAVCLVRAAGARVSHLTIYSLWPIPHKALRRAMTPFVRRVLIPELNLGLYADALHGVLHGVKIESLARYDGHLIEPAAIALRITDWPCG